MTPKAVDNNIKASPEIEAMIAKFKPTFGNQQDKLIADRYGELRNLLTLASRADERRLAAKKAVKECSVLKKDIKQREGQLLYLLKQKGLA